MIYARSRNEIKKVKKVSKEANKKAKKSHGKEKYDKQKRGEN